MRMRQSQIRSYILDSMPSNGRRHLRNFYFISIGSNSKLLDYLLTFYFILFISYTRPAESKGILQIESVVTYEFNVYADVVCECIFYFINVKFSGPGCCIITSIFFFFGFTMTFKNRIIFYYWIEIIYDSIEIV